MNKILIPTDFSEHSDYALEYASFIAKEKGGKLYILHIIENKKEMQYAKEKLKKIKDYSYLAGLDYEFKIEQGKTVSKKIKQVAKEIKAELIVMGSNGISNVEEMLLGSNTENVIRKSGINVLTIKHKMDNLKIDSILFPSNFAPESYYIFDSVLNYAKIFNAKIYLLSVVSTKVKKKNNVVDEKMDAFIDYFSLKKTQYEKVIFKDKSVELGILNFAIENDMDIIAIGTHGQSIVQKIIKESTSQKLVRDIFRPILTIKFLR